MSILDNREEIAKIDKQNVLGSVEALPEQCLHAWEEASKVEVPEDYRNVRNIVMCGMGGSGLGARVIESVYADPLKVPLVRINDYNLPSWVDESTLVFCSSYSGETEETIQNARQAIEKKAKWMAIGSGNTLIKMAQENKVPYYQIEPKYNPSNQPRMAIGYSIIGQLVLAAKVGVIKFSKEEVEKIVKIMNEVLVKTRVEIPENQNKAKQAALKMKDKVIIYLSAEHLTGAVHVVNNQGNENAKVFSTDFIIPELNHHLMEGLGYPDGEKKNLFAFFVDSTLYSDKITRRLLITREITAKQNLDSFVYQVTSSTKTEQAFEVIQFGAYVNFYLSMLYNQNPGPIPWVDYFKNKLGQPLGK